MKISDNGWNEYKKFVVEKLESHNEKLDCIDKKIGSILSRLAKLEVKAGIWGAIGGLIPVAILLITYLLTK